MKALRLSFFALILTAASPALAVQAFRGPLSSSQAGAGLAGLDGVEGVLLNPAQIALLRGYTLDLNYHDGDYAPGEHHQGWMIGAGDNGMGAAFPGALHYGRIRDTGRSPMPAEGEMIHFAVGERVGENFALGLSGYELIYRMKGHPKSTQWNYSLGALWMVTHEFGLAYVLDDIARPGSNVPVGLRERLQQGLGMYGVINDVASVRFDITRHETENPDKRLVYMLGFETMSSQFLIMRVGYRLDDEQDQRFVALGLGFNGPRLKVDYAFEKDMHGTAGALHSVDLRLPF